jgi:DNA-binding CsgD family transcriptional regulator/pimeloyl-ACP methyl ester carboxylesterase
MGAPPVRYVSTRDDYSIAYTVCGTGYPFIVLPSFINHVQDVWSDGFSVGNLLKDAAERYQVINYDSRGMGMSTRGLAPDLSLDSYFVDLEAVLERLGVNRCVLLGFASMSFLAVHFAVRYPERVAALILIGPPHRWLPAVWEELPRQDWEGFLADHVSRFYSPQMARRVLEMFKQWSTQEDYLASVRVWREARVDGFLLQLQTPTLVLWSRGLRVDEESVSDFTRLLPNGQLVFLDSGLPYGAPGEAIAAIEPFLRASGVMAGSEVDLRVTDSGLSKREIEVLRLLAGGRSNQQIADELFISLNTVIRHVSNIFGKTGVANRAEATSYAHRQRLID